MKIESLDELKSAADAWRRTKRHAREAVPSDLVERARRTIDVHGLGAVARATRIDRARLLVGRTGLARRRKGRVASVPAFSRMEITAPVATSRPFAEVEMPTGVKVRVFAESAETIGWLSLLCGIGGG